MDSKEKLTDRQLALVLAVEKSSGKQISTQDIFNDAEKFHRWLEYR